MVKLSKKTIFSKVIKDSSKSTNKLTITAALIQFIRPYSGVVLLAVFAILFTSVVMLSIGQGVRMLIDQGFAQQSIGQLRQAVLFILSITILLAVGSFFRAYLVSWLGERVSSDMRIMIFNHLISLHPSYFETHGSGDIISRITTDTSLLQSIIGSSFSLAIRRVLLMSGGIVMLFATNIKLTLIVLLSVPFILVPILFYGRKVRALSRKSQDAMANVGSYAGEAIEQIKTVQSYTREKQEKTTFELEVEQSFQVGRERIKQQAILITAVIMIVLSAITAMLWIGGRDVINGQMSGGDLAAFVFYAILVASSMAAISEVIGELQRAAGATERLIEILQVNSHILAPKEHLANSQSLSAEVAFKSVSFCYPSRAEQTAIETLNLTAETGKVLALVGPSGAGKSTIFELLQRFYDPQQGHITFGGIDIKQLNPQQLRQKMALVPQQPALFSHDVMHNIRYGNPNASDEEVIVAAKQAHAHEFIMNLPDGYKSFLGERGVRLSGGQRQRIAIARAILKAPDVLLLDEATSALDSESEYHVQQGLAALMHGRTTLIIAHRLSTIQHADSIAVLEQGRVIATGSHQSLLSSCPLYQRLVELQLKQT
jgi:ATP-binding cassette subfamily B protein